jgi:hypothetical protein
MRRNVVGEKRLKLRNAGHKRKPKPHGDMLKRSAASVRKLKQHGTVP